MLTNKLTIFFFLSLIICSSSTSAQSVSVTQLEATFLRDDIGLLNREQQQEITGLLTEHNKKFPGRIYLDLLHKLPDGKTIQQYAYDRLNEQPRMPDEKADKILIVVAISDKAVRIETSRDVWQVLSDDYCRQVNREIMIPKFKLGEYFAGIKSGIEALINKLEKP